MRTLANKGVRWRNRHYVDAWMTGQAGRKVRLPAICADNPGAFLGTGEAQAEGELDAADLDKVKGTLTNLGYAIVPEELLECDYAGPSQLPWHVQRPTWWHRYFGSF